MYRFYFILISLFVLISCSSNNYDSNYEKFISELEQITVEDSTRIKLDNSPVYKPLKLTANKKGKVIVVDASNWTLHLMDKQGKFLDRTGGSGRGPNEYLGINQVHIGADNKLYVYDAKSYDITIYSFIEDSFNLKHEIGVPAHDSLDLKTIHKTRSGYIGVFNQVGVPVDKENTFKVYSLGEDLQLQELLFEMPANETYSLQGIQEDHPVGTKTKWELNDGRFFYTNSNNLSVTSVNLEDESSKQYDFSDIPKPVKGEEEIKAIESRLRPIIQKEPQVKELIREGQYLPYFLKFTAGKDYFYYTLFRLGKENGILLRIDKATKEIRKITVPSVFALYAVHNNTLFGIDHTTVGASEIMFLKIGG